MPKRRVVLITQPLDGAGSAQQVAILSRSMGFQPVFARNMGFQPVSSGPLPHGLEAHATEEFDLHVLALSHDGSLSANFGAPATAIGLRGPYDLAGLWQLRRAIARLRPDLVHTWGAEANLVGRFAAISAGVPRVVATENGVDPLKPAHRWSMERWLAQHTARIVAVSPHVRQWCQAGGLPAEKLPVIPGCVPIVNSSDDRSAILAELGLPSDSRLIATLAPLESHNRLKDIIWAAELLHFIREDVHLLVIGDGPQRQMLTRYRDLIRVTQHVHFLGLRDDARRLISHCHLLWHGGGLEGQPQAVMEALAAGIPVVAADTPGVRLLLTNGEQGYIVPLGDRAALARFANVLIDDAGLRAKLGAAGRERMEREFSVKRMFEAYADLYRELLQ